MCKTPRLTASEAEKLLNAHGFKVIRTKGSHKVFFKGGKRIVVPLFYIMRAPLPESGPDRFQVHAVIERFE
ncbi:MAG: type II toxin-antitoxin system HicA family toxin [Spirochaetales bacterium]|nr:type II toxin-antitoxin system HicA family toxin [Spirochaetales bacterium]